MKDLTDRDEALRAADSLSLAVLSSVSSNPATQKKKTEPNATKDQTRVITGQK